jgi:Family of unknown function (DUF6544)
MSAMFRRLPAVAGMAVLAGTCAQVAGDRAFARLVRQDVQALHARAAPARAGVVTEQMLTDLPEPVRRYLRYTGVVGKPFPGTVRLRQEGRMRVGPGRRWIPLDAEEHYSVQPPGFVWAGTLRVGPLPVARARDMYAKGEGRMLVKVASLWPVVNASGEQMNQGETMRYLSEMIWFPAAFLAGNIAFEPVDDSCARVILTDHGRTATGTMFFDQQGRFTDFVAQRYRTPDASSPDTWSTPFTGYGEFEGLRLPTRGKALYKLPGGDLEYIEVTLTGLHYDTGAAPQGGRHDEGTGQRGHQIRGHR